MFSAFNSYPYSLEKNPLTEGLQKIYEEQIELTLRLQKSLLYTTQGILTLQEQLLRSLCNLLPNSTPSAAQPVANPYALFTQGIEQYRKMLEEWDRRSHPFSHGKEGEKDGSQPGP